jgi:GDPmannose 4,6-dehydratase
MKTVIITGVLGQDGSNMSKYILDNVPDHLVVGIYKRGSNPNTENIMESTNHPNFKMVSADITDQASMDNLVQKFQPDYFINFAANSFVGTSWDTPEQVFEVNTLGVLKCLEAIRKFKKDCRFYSAGSSEEFGEILYVPQDERHPLIPVSPYAVAKVAARHTVDVYRRSYGLFAIHGTLFNHEGPKRGTEFVTRKVTKNVARILVDLERGVKPTPFKLGNIYAHKDWSDSRDMVRGIWMMLQQNEPKEFILASNKTRTIASFVDTCFKVAGIPGKWIINPNFLDEYYEVMINGEPFKAVEIDKNLYRPTEVGVQQGDYSAIKRELGWEPLISFDQMIKEMIENDKSIIRKS